MNLAALDWAIVVAYFAFSTIVGLVFTKRGGESLNEFFLSGRDVPWWLAGTSMVATTFAADTPLLVTGLVANHGVAGNWLWWNMVMSGMLTVFFFARLWRRSGVMTDVEFAEIRYSGKPAAVLRGFRALYLGLLMNVLIMGWVTRAMIKILTISLGINPITAVAICFAATVVYAAAGGLWAVLWTDLVQFVIKMGAVIVLAIYSVRAVGGIDKLKAGVAAHFGSETAALSVMPIQHGPHGFQAYAWMPLLTIGVFIAVQWWSSWYPGAEPGGGGYVAQRIFAAKTERDGVLATLLFQVAHYALRPWPWIVTALATVILYPNLADKESGYVHAFVDLLPTPWRGVMMAGFAAAYMSTIGTQLNWGASYLVNDFYKRFIRKSASDKHYVAVSRLATIGLFLVALAVTTQLSSIERVQKYLLAIGAGTGLVLILRWYWQRINAWSELSAMIASLVISTIAMHTILPRFAAGDPNADAWVMIVTVGATTVIWLTVTMLTPKEPAHVLDAFNKRVRPEETHWAVSWANWVAGVVAVYASLFGIGKLIFGETGAGLGLLALAIVAFAWIGRSFRIYSEDTRRSEG
jgi:Na+/proline symporter